MEKVMVIGVAGGSGSGKTTLANKLAREFAGSVTVLHHDDYYKARGDMSYEERAALNYDHPDAFDTELMAAQLKALREGCAVDAPVYDYRSHDRSGKTRRLNPTQVIVVEGILIFACPELCELMDIKIFVDTDADVRLIRRIRRDVSRRGRSLESVMRQYLGTVKPMHEQFVEPSRKNADLIVLEGGHNLVAMDMIINRIRRHIEEE